jgi:hypothetical protein
LANHPIKVANHIAETKNCPVQLKARKSIHLHSECCGCLVAGFSSHPDWGFQAILGWEEVTNSKMGLSQNGATIIQKKVIFYDCLMLKMRLETVNHWILGYLSTFRQSHMIV